MHKILPFLVLFSSLSASAALPPFGESIRRINTLLSDEALRTKAGEAAFVNSVALTDETNGIYQVRSKAGECVPVQVTCGPNTVVGPCPLIVKVLDSACE